MFAQGVTPLAQTFFVDAARVFLTDCAAFGKILLLRRGPSLSYLAAIDEAFLAFRSHCYGSRKASRFSSYTSPRFGTKSFSLVQNAFLQAEHLPFLDVLTEEEIHAAFVAEDACFGEDEDDIYTPAITLWGWLAQVMQAEKARSCVAAVARIAT